MFHDSPRVSIRTCGPYWKRHDIPYGWNGAVRVQSVAACGRDCGAGPALAAAQTIREEKFALEERRKGYANSA
ncbi:hypothetical protein CBM2585_A130181 [Cupriavidus taiwanensis]|nr:hypothetical protein CBM2585_A130181 [Cupriavidus taiwanensis]